jgi:hypothetical protein
VSYKEFQELRNQITSVLDESLKKLEEFKSSLPVQKQNEPVNKKKTKQINNKSTAEAKKVS